MKLHRAVAAVTALTLAVAPMAAPMAVAAGNALSLPPVASAIGPNAFCAQQAGPIASAPITAALARANLYRSLAGRGPLTENTAWSHGDRLHARYEVKNSNPSHIEIGHDEDPTNAWCTDAGRAAAQASNVMVSYSTATTDAQAIDMWMQGPFHAVGIIDPALHRTGYGAFRQNFPGSQVEMAAALDVIRGLGSLPAGLQFPIRYPIGNKALPIRSAPTGEYPNPLSGCSGYAAPSGPPIILQLGHFGSAVPHVTAHSLKLNGVVQPSCEFDETNYTNTADPSGQSLGRQVLGMRDAVVLMPKKPLQAGKTYAVSITNSGHVYTWSFKVAANAQ
jgi:uncharacterized protein YkwD